MSFELPSRGLVFWPVENGDSTTVVIDSDTHLQVDLDHLEKAEDDDEAAWPVIDELVERLPKVDGRPYLSAFALTHPDRDHCRGFERLLDEVDIGELWFTPRIFREYTEDLSDHAEAFKKEAERRVEKTIEAEGGDPGAGDRVRIFGYSDILSTLRIFPTMPRPSRRRPNAVSRRRSKRRAAIRAPATGYASSATPTYWKKTTSRGFRRIA